MSSSPKEQQQQAAISPGGAHKPPSQVSLPSPAGNPFDVLNEHPWTVKDIGLNSIAVKFNFVPPKKNRNGFNDSIGTAQ